MPISEAQLETWSHQGAVITSAAIANRIKDVLNSHRGFPAEITFDLYLSGSYKNDTNVYGESDVDIVIELTSSFYSNLTNAQNDQLGLIDATYGYFDFRDEVVTCLQGTYEESVNIGNKAIQIDPIASRHLYADVLVCSTYRLYSEGLRDFKSGVAFYTRQSGYRIVNYPKLHSQNAALKHQATRNYFKGTVRIFKNMRNTMIEQGLLSKEDAPSYFIECLLFNVPTESFSTSWSRCVFNVLTYLNTSRSWANFMCINNIISLWDSSAWNEQAAKNFISLCIGLWKRQ